jgi:hypothetical protein
VPGGERDVDEATALYELWLRYYVLGLNAAGSPYAFHTIGSTLSVHAEAYAKVRGFPRRDAAEDFYLLNKLAKVGPVTRVRARPIRITSRRSSRVPFGTGRKVTDLTAPSATPLGFYDPRVFAALGRWHELLRAIADWGGTDVPRARRLESAARFVDGWLSNFAERREFGAASEAVAQSLRAELDAEKSLPQVLGILAGAPRAQRLRRVFEWFDGFRTLRLVHRLEAAHFSSKPWMEAFARAPFLGTGALADLDGALGALRALEAELPASIGPTLL